MDPYAAIENLIEAIADGDRDTAQDTLDDLITWGDRDGFLPRMADITSRRTAKA